MAQRGKTRRRLVASTIHLLRRQGAHGTGLQEVLDHSGAPRGSLYFHFPGGKEELIREAIQEAAGAVDRWLLESLEHHSSVAEGMDHFLGRYGEHMAAAGFSEGCPVAAVALDVGPGSERLLSACDWAMSGWATLLAERLREEGRDPEDAESLALTAVAALEGSLVVCRARRSLEPLGAVGSQLKTLLEPPPAPI
jgi:TetR/AcrR family transcriptional regulator, lmrAB and yxaGH operons repressor